MQSPSDAESGGAEMTVPLRITVLTRPGDGVNAIHDASACLVEALNRSGCSAELVDWAPGSMRASARGADVLLVPYNPFMYGRWGFAPLLVRDVAALRLQRPPRPVLTLLVHESYVSIRGWKSLLMGGWQRLQLWTLLLLVDRSFASIDSWARTFSRVRRTAVIPSGSTLPDARAARDRVRSELGISDRLVIASLSTGHPSHLPSYIAASLRRVANGGRSAVFLQLGAGANHVEGIPGSVNVIRPGRVSSERLAELVAASDMLLTPFADGVSTRRTSFMAGLQQQVAVVGTSGASTEPYLCSVGLEIVEGGSADLFAERAAQLAADTGRRAHVAAVGHKLFEERFTANAIATQFLEGIVEA